MKVIKLKVMGVYCSKSNFITGENDKKRDHMCSLDSQFSRPSLEASSSEIQEIITEFHGLDVEFSDWISANCLRSYNFFTNNLITTLLMSPVLLD
jgi:hypothetical protein